MITALVLAAGLSSRFGSPKALAPIQNNSAINFILEKLIQSKVSEIIVVLGADFTKIKPTVLNNKIIYVVENKDYAFGQTSSVQAGLKIISPVSTGFMLCPVDCPFIATQTVNILIENFTKTQQAILVPTFKNQRGHPPILNIRLTEDVQKLSHTQSVNTIFKKNSNLTTTLEINDPGITKSFNTPDELLAIKKELKIT